MREFSAAAEVNNAVSCSKKQTKTISRYRLYIYKIACMGTVDRIFTLSRLGSAHADFIFQEPL